MSNIVHLLRILQFLICESVHVMVKLYILQLLKPFINRYR